MKKIFLAIGIVFAAGILFTSESPSLDGRAVVADEGLFPKGLFAKTVGYLPGDSISVTNPANGERVDILVIGSLDPSDGVAVLLSPEAASALNIKKNSNNLVKLTKRNGAADEVVNGSAVLSSDPNSVVAEAEPSKPLEQVVEEALANNVPVEEAVAEAVEEAEDKVAEKAFDQAEADLAVEEELEEAVSEAAVVEEIAEEEAVVEESPVVEEVAEAEVEETPEYEELVVDELAASEENAADDDILEDTVKDAPLVSEEPSAPVEEEPVFEDEAIDEYDAIVLVPSESKAPEALPETESVVIEPEKVVESETYAPKSSGVSYIGGDNELAYQKYYVQIAVYNKAENVEQFASQYADLYPITVIQGSGKSPVLVGPLNVDEYGVVLERFRSYGFKDAFVKIGKGQAKAASYNPVDFER